MARTGRGIDELERLELSRIEVKEPEEDGEVRALVHEFFTET